MTEPSSQPRGMAQRAVAAMTIEFRLVPLRRDQEDAYQKALETLARVGREAIAADAAVRP